MGEPSAVTFEDEDEKFLHSSSSNKLKKKIQMNVKNSDAKNKRCNSIQYFHVHFSIQNK